MPIPLSATTKNNVTIHGNLASDNTLVLGHGFGTDQTAWRFIINDFISDFRILTYDNVGAGGADPSAFNQLRYAKLESYADDLIDLCAEHAVQNAIFIGHSVSGMIGMLASLKAPELFAKHVFMNASPRYLNDEAYTGGFEQSDLDSLFDAMAKNYQAWVAGFSQAAMDNPDKPQLAEEFARTLKELRPDRALAVSKAIFESDYRRFLVAFEKESLIIQSSKDIAVPLAVGEYLHQHLAKSKLLVINAMGHLPHISAPVEITKAIQSFIV